VSGFGLSHDAAEEIAQETVVHAYTQDLRRIENPGGFLFWIARNRAIDHLRRARRSERVEILAWDVEKAAPMAHYSAEDDAIATLLAHDGTADLVEHALRAANAADDALVARVVGAWLELADRLGRAPSSREVAPQAAVSHTSVNQALKRFRGYFPNVDSESSSV
jgi:DNA-directed RNA polymerase specialized sigma24 family protein